MTLKFINKDFPKKYIIINTRIFLYIDTIIYVDVHYWDSTDTIT